MESKPNIFFVTHLNDGQVLLSELVKWEEIDSQLDLIEEKYKAENIKQCVLWQSPPYRYALNDFTKLLQK